MDSSRDKSEAEDNVFEHITEAVESVTKDCVPGGLHPVYLGDTMVMEGTRSCESWVTADTRRFGSHKKIGGMVRGRDFGSEVASPRLGGGHPIINCMAQAP